MKPKEHSPSPSKTSNDAPRHASKYFIVGLVVTLFNYIVYTIINQTVLTDPNLLWLDSLISCVITTFFGYLLHSKITWRERHPTRTSILKFFIWNLFMALAINPLFTWLFGFLDPIYQFAFNISSALHLPFDYNFVESTLIFCLTGFVVMILNFLFYDRIVFSSQNNFQKKSKQPPEEDLI